MKTLFTGILLCIIAAVNAQTVTPKGTLKSWFITGAKPTQEQYWNWMDSYWHKSELIPATSIEGLQNMDTMFVHGDSLFYVRNDSIFFAGIVSGGGDSGVVTLQYLTPGYGLAGNNYNGSGPATFAADTSILALKSDILVITPGGDSATYIVDSITNTPPVGAVNGNKYLIGTSPSGAFAGHANQIATLIGGVWNYQTPAAQQQLIVDNPASYTSYQFTGIIWKQTSVLLKAGGNKGIGNVTLGALDNKNVRIITNNTLRLQIDSAGNVFLLKLKGFGRRYFLRPDSATGRLVIDSFSAYSGVKINGVVHPFDSTGLSDLGTITGGSGGSDTSVALSLVDSLAITPARQYAKAVVADPVRGGSFVARLASDGFAADNGMVFNSATPGLVWVRNISQAAAVNVKWWGAKGIGSSGVNADTAAFKSAMRYLKTINNALPLYVPDAVDANGRRSYYALAGDGVYVGDNFKMYGDGPHKSEVRVVSPTSNSGPYKGSWWYFSTYGADSTSNPLQYQVKRYSVNDANINDTLLKLVNIADATGMYAGEVIMYGCWKTVHGGTDFSKLRLTYWECNEISRISNDTVFFKNPIRINLIHDPVDNSYAMILNINNNAGISPTMNIPNGNCKNIDIGNMMLTQSQYNELADTTLSKQLGGVWQPGGAYNAHLHDLTVQGYLGLRWQHVDKYNLGKYYLQKSEGKLTDFGYASSRLTLRNIHYLYNESPASNFATALIVMNDDVHDISYENIIAEGDNFRGTTIFTTSGVQNMTCKNVVVNFPNYYYDQNLLQIGGDSSRPSKDIYINDCSFNVGGAGNFLWMVQSGASTIPNNNINISNVQFHGKLLGYYGNNSYTFTFTATNKPIRNDTYSTNGSTYAMRDAKATQISTGVYQATFIRTAGTNDPASSGTLTRVYGAGDASISYSAFAIAAVSSPLALNMQTYRGVKMFNVSFDTGKISLKRDTACSLVALRSGDSLLITNNNYNDVVGVTTPTANVNGMGSALSIINNVPYINGAAINTSGNINTGALNNLAYYAAAGNTISPLSHIYAHDSTFSVQDFSFQEVSPDPFGLTSSKALFIDGGANRIYMGNPYAGATPVDIVHGVSSLLLHSFTIGTLPSTIGWDGGASKLIGTDGGDVTHSDMFFVASGNKTHDDFIWYGDSTIVSPYGASFDGTTNFQKMKLNGITGQFRLYKYGVGNFSATPAYLLGVGSDGSVVETSVSSGGGTSSYVDKTISNTYTAGAKQIFGSSSTTAGMNFAGVSSDPTTLSDGDLWLNTTANNFKYRAGGSTYSIAPVPSFVSVSSLTTTSNTLVDATGLSRPLLANKTYYIHGTLQTTTDASGAGYQIAFTVPTAATININITSIRTGNTALGLTQITASGTQNGQTIGNISGGGASQAEFSGYITTSSTAGNVQMQWRSATSGATQTINWGGMHVQVVQ